MLVQHVMVLLLLLVFRAAGSVQGCSFLMCALLTFSTAGMEAAPFSWWRVLVLPEQLYV